MPAILSALARAMAQLSDPAVLRILLKSLAATIAIFLLVAAGGWYLIDWARAGSGLADDLFAGASGVRGAVSLLLALAGLWLIWRIVAMAVIQFFADDLVEAVEARHYPDAARNARQLPVGEQLAASLGGATRALLLNLAVLPVALVLLFTGVGAALVFWLVNALLVGRELQDMVWLRHRRHKGQHAPISGGERFVLGAIVVALLAVPFVNFLAPVLGAGASAHLIHRKERARPDA